MSEKRSQSESVSTKSFLDHLLFRTPSSIVKDSSDEDESGPDDQYLKGARGVIVFQVYCVKTDVTKIIQIDLYNGTITQYIEGNQKKKKVFQCSDIQNVNIRPDHQVVIDKKRPNDVAIRQKKFLFEKDEEAEQFCKYVSFRKEFGAILKNSFDFIDRKGAQIITVPALEAALRSVDIHIPIEDVNMMITINGNEKGFLDFHDYFHLFLDSRVSSLRDCLLEWLGRTRLLDEEKEGSIQETESFSNMPGEILANIAENVRWTLGGSRSSSPLCYQGTMYTTNYRILLKSFRRDFSLGYHSKYDFPHFFNSITIPLYALHKVSAQPPNQHIQLVVKDHRVVRIFLSPKDSLNSGAVDGVCMLIQRMAFSNLDTVVTSPCSNSFAFRYKGFYNFDGWLLSDLRAEYERQGLDDSARWQIVDNSDWSISETYPSWLVLPAALTQSEIRAVSSHRSKNRLPAITYRHASSEAVMSRSAQPMVGFLNAKCKEDEKMLDLYRLKGVPFDPRDSDLPSKFYIYDARRQIAATLNQAAGKGTEDISTYSHSDLVFCNIENIHVMRTSANEFADLLLPGSGSNASTPGLDSQSQSGNHLDTGSMIHGFLKGIDDSGWLKHIRLLILSSVSIAEKMHLEGSSVLVHCSDGWDRTAQLCSLSQILLDPYFRTIEGLAVLIEKDWCSFGFKFQDRCGLGGDHSVLTEERSPVFLQFLDCVHQIMCQFPLSFEYSEELLVFLADHSHSGLFGNFLGNCERQRTVDLAVMENTQSIWSHVIDQKDAFLNPNYSSYPRPIWPSCSVSKFFVWHRYFSRWDPEAHPNQLSQSWTDDWGRLSDRRQPALYRMNTTIKEHFRLRRASNPQSCEQTSDVRSISVEVEEAHETNDQVDEFELDSRESDDISDLISDAQTALTLSSTLKPIQEAEAKEVGQTRSRMARRITRVGSQKTVT